MKYTHWLLVGCLAGSAMMTSTAFAQNIEMRYSTLFGKLKQNAVEGHDDVKIAFYLLDQRDGSVCKIHKGWMQKDKHYEELNIPADNALDVPLDSNLRQANPDVTFVVDDGITCDVSMQVIATSEYGRQISQAQVQSLAPQMDKLLSDLGGMFSKWFMPKVGGVVLHFDQPLQAGIILASGNVAEAQGNKVILKLDALSAGEVVKLPDDVVKVTPWIPKS